VPERVCNAPSAPKHVTPHRRRMDRRSGFILLWRDHALTAPLQMQNVSP
jgi:hypothetical protein